MDVHRYLGVIITYMDGVHLKGSCIVGLGNGQSKPFPKKARQKLVDHLKSSSKVLLSGHPIFVWQGVPAHPGASFWSSSTMFPPSLLCCNIRSIALTVPTKTSVKSIPVSKPNLPPFQTKTHQPTPPVNLFVPEPPPPEPPGPKFATASGPDLAGSGGGGADGDRPRSHKHPGPTPRGGSWRDHV